MILEQGYRRLAEALRREIEDDLTTVGILCRVFGRAKTTASLRKKIDSSPGKYSLNGRLIQDLVGLRVVVYFPEDVPIVEELLRARYSCDDGSCTIDKPIATVFSVTRHNLIFRIPDKFSRDIQPVGEIPIDTTFEVQLRTILSEGWHEVEHDLRYKKPAHWSGHDDLNRGLNGVVATLETAEWSMRKIFDDLAARHFATGQWDAMLHSALRMRLTAPLTPNIVAILDENPSVANSFYRIKRMAVFRSLSRLAPRIPLTLGNVVYLWNFTNLRNPKISEITPQVLSENFEASLGGPAVGI